MNNNTLVSYGNINGFLFKSNRFDICNSMQNTANELISRDKLYIPSTLMCGNKELLILMAFCMIVTIVNLANLCITVVQCLVYSSLYICATRSS